MSCVPREQSTSRLSCSFPLTVRNISKARTDVSRYLTGLSGLLYSHSHSQSPDFYLFIFFFSFLQPTANLFVVTKHRLSRGWFHWEALPDMRGALMWLTHTHYCCLIQGLRGLMSLCFLLYWHDQQVSENMPMCAQRQVPQKWNLGQIVINSRSHCCFMQI